MKYYCARKQVGLRNNRMGMKSRRARIETTVALYYRGLSPYHYRAAFPFRC